MPSFYERNAEDNFNRALRGTQVQNQLREAMAQQRATELYRDAQMEQDRQKMLQAATFHDDEVGLGKARLDQAWDIANLRASTVASKPHNLTDVEKASSLDAASNSAMNMANPPSAVPTGLLGGMATSMRQKYFADNPSQTPGPSEKFQGGLSGLKELHTQAGALDKSIGAADTALRSHVAGAFPGVNYDDISGKAYQFPPIPLDSDGKTPRNRDDITASGPTKTVYLQPPNKAPSRGTQKGWDETLGLAGSLEALQAKRKLLPSNIPPVPGLGATVAPSSQPQMTAPSPARASITDPAMAIQKIQNATNFTPEEKQRRIAIIQQRAQGK